MDIEYDPIWDNLKLVPTPEQEEHLPGVSWLFSGPIRSGRSTVLAVAIIKKAILVRPQWVQVIDHWPGYRARNDMLDNIKQILYPLPTDHPLRKHVEFRGSNLSIRFNYK